MATSARHALYAVKESSYGVTPENPTFASIRNTGTTLMAQRAGHISNEQRANRQIPGIRPGQKQGTGDIPFELSFGTFDDLLAAVLCGTWDGNTLKAGTARTSFSLLRYYSDLESAAKPYHLFPGMEINTLALTVPLDGIVTGTFGCVGKPPVLSETKPSGATLEEDGDDPVLVSLDTSSIKEDDVELGIATELTLNVDNGITPRFAIGDDEPVRQGSIGRSNVTGQLTAYFETADLLEKYIEADYTSLEWTFEDPEGNSYTFLIPRLQFTGGQADAGTNTDITIPLPWQAVYDPANGTNIVVTRQAADDYGY